MKQKQFVIQRTGSSLSHKLQNERKQFVIMKRIAKHGRQAVIIIPAFLQNQLKPGTLLQLTMDVLEEGRA